MNFLKFFQKRRYFFSLLVFAVVFTAAIRLQNQSNYEIDFDAKELILTGPVGTEKISVIYDKIQSIALIENYKAGELTAGIKKKNLLYGKFKNQVYGEYFLCVLPTVSNAIEIQTDSFVVVFNYESEDVTAALCDALIELVQFINKKGGEIPCVSLSIQ